MCVEAKKGCQIPGIEITDNDCRLSYGYWEQNLEKQLMLLIDEASSLQLFHEYVLFKKLVNSQR